MYIYLRLASTLLKSRFSPRQDPRSEVRTRIRIWPNDLDFNGHVNNGRYLTLFDLGRMDLTMRTGLWPLIMKRRWYPVLSTASIRFRRSIKPFAVMDMTTTIIYFDDKWLFIEHRFEKDGDIYARALVKGLFRGPEGNIPMTALLAAMGADPTPMAMPPLVAHWAAFDAELSRKT